MRKILFNGLLLTLLLFNTSCIDDKFDYEDCLYRLRVELNFINTEPIDEKEELVLTVVAAEGNVQPNFRMDLTTDIHGRDLELLADAYHFVSYEPALNVSVVDNIVTVVTYPDGTAMQPATFSGGASAAQVLANLSEQVIHVPLHLQVRELIIEIKLSGDGVPYLKDINGSLDGIAISRLINNGFEPIEKNGRPHAIKNGSILYKFAAKEKVNQTFIGSNVLLGVDGRVNQMLHLSAITSLGIIKDYELTVTESLSEFHIKNVHEPWYIKLELNLDSKLEMTIEDWKSGPESELIAQ